MNNTFISLLFSLILGINISSAQTYFFEDFENGIDHWSLVDYNNDGRNWISFFPSGYPDFGAKSIYSRSIYKIIQEASVEQHLISTLHKDHEPIQSHHFQIVLT